MHKCKHTNDQYNCRKKARGIKKKILIELMPRTAEQCSKFKYGPHWHCKDFKRRDK